MGYLSNKIQLLILSATAALISRTVLALFDDPEGPNLLVVAVAAVLLYAPSVVVYIFSRRWIRSNPMRLIVAIVAQLLLGTLSFFLFR